MLHFALPTERHHAAPRALLPITPAHYLRLRREAAGLSIAAVARRIGAGVTLICQLETEGVTARHRDTIMELAQAFPLDPDVYMQLSGASAEQHPRICQSCGCSHWDPCVSGDGAESCGWHDAAKCTRCAQVASKPVRQ